MSLSVRLVAKCSVTGKKGLNRGKTRKDPRVLKKRQFLIPEYANRSSKEAAVEL